MNESRFSRQSLLALCLTLLLGYGLAQAQPAKDYEPSVGQEGKDVVWVPTPQALVDKMLDMAKVTPKDYVIDLGSGDGRTVITAAKRGSKALGIEYNPDMVELSKRNAAKEGVSDKANFVKADLFESDFSQASRQGCARPTRPSWSEEGPTMSAHRRRQQQVPYVGALRSQIGVAGFIVAAGGHFAGDAAAGVQVLGLRSASTTSRIAAMTSSGWSWWMLCPLLVATA